MATAPINHFEVIESIRFFAQLVGTEGIPPSVKDKVGNYLEILVDSLETSVKETATIKKAGDAGLII